MVRTFFDLKKAEENNPRPPTLQEDEHWNPLSPRKEVLQEYAKAKYDYEKSVHDRAGDEWYELVKGKPDKITQEITQCYRINVAADNEYIFYNATLRGEDWKGNEHDFALLEGRYSKPIFRYERDPQTDKVTSSQINDHVLKYDILWSKDKFDELLKSATDNISMAVYGTAGRRLSISSLDDYRDGTIDDLIQCSMKGKSLESVLAEKNQFTYEKRESKEPKGPTKQHN